MGERPSTVPRVALVTGGTAGVGVIGVIGIIGVAEDTGFSNGITLSIDGGKDLP